MKSWCLSPLCGCTLLFCILTLVFFFALTAPGISATMTIDLNNASFLDGSNAVHLNGEDARYSFDISEYYPWATAIQLAFTFSNTDKGGITCDYTPPQLYVKKKDQDAYDWFANLSNSSDTPITSWFTINSGTYVESNGSGGYRFIVKIHAHHCVSDHAEVDVDGFTTRLTVNYDQYNYMQVEGSPKVVTFNNANLGASNSQNVNIKNIGGGSAARNWRIRSTDPSPTWVNAKDGSVVAAGTGTIPVEINSANISSANVGQLSGKLVPIYDTGLDPTGIALNPTSIGLKGDLYHFPGAATLSNLNTALADTSKKLVWSSIFPTIEFHKSAGITDAYSETEAFKSGLTTTTLRRNFVAVFTGFITISTPGSHRFYVTSDDGFRLTVNNIMVTEYIYGRGTTTSQNTISLESGIYPIELDYFQGSGAKSLTLEWEQPGQSRAVVPSNVLKNGLNILVRVNPLKPTVAFTTAKGSNNKVNATAGQSFTLTVSATNGSTGVNVTGYRWQKVIGTGPAGTGFDSTTVAEKPYPYTDAGDYTVYCKSVDAKGVESTLAFIPVYAWNPPTVNNTPPQANIDNKTVSWYSGKYVGVINQDVNLMAAGTLGANNPTGESIQEFKWDLDNNWNESELLQPANQPKPYKWAAPNTAGRIRCKAVTNYGIESAEKLFDLKVYDIVRANAQGPYNGRPTKEVALTGSINTSSFAGAEFVYKWYVKSGTTFNAINTGPDGKAKYTWTTEGTYEVKFEGTVTTQERLVLTGSATTTVSVVAGVPTAMPGGPYRGGIAGGNYSPIQFEGNDPNFVEAEDIGKISEWVWFFDHGPDIDCSESRILLAENTDQMVSILTGGTATATKAIGFSNSGDSSIKVAPVGGPTSLKYNTAISGWSFKIVQNPVAADEFRYITFAWCKEGGTGIMIQIYGSPGTWNHRYHAGVNVNNWIPSIQVDAAIPAQWQVVTRDLYADWGAFTVTGIGLTPLDGTAGYFDDMYLHKSPTLPIGVACSVETRTLLAENADQVIGYLSSASGNATIENITGFVNSGEAAIKIGVPTGATSAQRYGTPAAWSYNIVENPVAANEFRYITFAWRKEGGTGIMIQIASSGGNWAHRYHAGTNVGNWIPSIQVDAAMPTEWQMVTRDLYTDWGAFALIGLALTPFNGTAGYFDDIYLHKTPYPPIGTARGWKVAYAYQKAGRYVASLKVKSELLKWSMVDTADVEVIDGKITGYVRAADLRTPVKNARLTLTSSHVDPDALAAVAAGNSFKLHTNTDGSIYTVTDSLGFYSFEHIPLGSYRVVVSKVEGGTIHNFENSGIKATELTLDAPNQLAIDFVDLSVFPVSGRVVYSIQKNGVDVLVEDVVIIAQPVSNANSIQSLPSAKSGNPTGGNYSLPLFSGQYLFLANRPEHNILIKTTTPGYDYTTGLVNIDRARTDIDFVDYTTRTLTIFVQDSGGYKISNKAISVSGDNGQATGNSDSADGKLVATLPPGKYTVTVVGALPETKEADLTGGDQAVTMTIPVPIVLAFTPRPKLFDVPDDFLAQFGLTPDQNPEGYMYYYPPEPRTHTYVLTATANGNPVDDFKLFITDEVSMMTDDPPEEQEIQVEGAQGRYIVTAGVPKLDLSVTPPLAAAKRITFKAEKEGYVDSAPVTDSVTVLGDVGFGDPARIVSIPMVNYTVLHDPPGDGSYSFLDDSLKLKGIVSGMTITMHDIEVPVYPSPWRDERIIDGFKFGKESGSDTTFKDMGNAGLMSDDRFIMPSFVAYVIAAAAEALVGAATVATGPAAFVVQLAMLPILGVSLEEGTAIPGVTGAVQYEVSPNRHLETSSGDSLTDLVGPGKGDIYFGEGWTLGLRNTYRLGMKLVNNQWQLQTQQIMTYQIIERTNQYVYTIRDILDIIANLDIAIAGATDNNEKTKLTTAKNTWQSLLDKNLAYKWQKDYVSQGKSFDEFKSSESLPEASENLIFSAGPTFQYSRAIKEGISSKVSVKVGVESAAEAEMKFKVFSGANFWGTGVEYATEMGGTAAINSGTEYGAEWEGGKGAEQTVGFVLKDDDIGDNISTRVYADPVWGTPIFFQDQGSITSDPWEAGTRKAVDLTLELLDDASGTYDYHNGAHYKVKVQYAGLRELETNWIDFVIYDLWTDNNDNMTVRFNGQPGPYSFSLGKQSPTATFMVSLYPPERDQANSENKEYSVVIEVDEVADCYQINRVVTLTPEFADLRAPRATIEAPYAGQRVSPVFFPSTNPFLIQVVSEDMDLSKIQLEIRTKQPNGVLEQWRILSGMLWQNGVENPNVDVNNRLNRVPPRREFTFKWTENEIKALGVGEYYIRAVATDKATIPNTDINPPDVLFLVDDSKPTVLTTIPDYQERESQRIYKGELSAVFTDDMRADDFSDRTFYVTDLLKNNEKVGGFVSYSPALRKAIFVPVVPFDPNGFYRVEIKTDVLNPPQRGVHDLAGNPLDNAFMFTFHTLDTPFEPTWSITLSVINGTSKDANNIAAVEYGASDGTDEKDALSAPIQASKLRLSFLDRSKVEYDRDIRPADGRLSHHWFFIVGNAANGTSVTIKWKPSINLISTSRQYQVIRLIEFKADGTVNTTIKLDPMGATIDPTTGQISELIAHTYTNAGEIARYFRLDVQKANLVATTLQKGTSNWKFLSVPITPQRADPFVNLGDDIDPLQLYKYDAQMDGYKIYPLDLGAVSLQTGYGYFTRLQSSIEVDVGGISNLENVTLQPPFGVAGWYAIGNPFILPVNVSDLKINNQTFADAVTNNLVEDTLYRWKVVTGGGGSDSYEAIKSTSQLLPWEGYWFKTKQANVSLVIPAPAGIGTAIAPLPPSFNPPMAPPMVKPLAAGQFDLRLELISSFSSDVTTVFGTRDNAQTGWDTLDQSEPPILSQTTSIYFDHTDWGDGAGIYNTDYQPTMKAGEERIWTFTVFTDRPGTEMKLSWANAVAQIPDDMMFYFRQGDGQSDWQDMRKIQSVNLVSQSLISRIPFEVRVKRFAMSPIADVQVIAGEKQAILRWKSDSNEFITGYVITRQEGSAQDWENGEGVKYILQQNPANLVSEFVDTDLMEEITYTYQIEVQFMSGAILPSELLTIRTLPVIKGTVLLQNYPNPANPDVWIPYELADQEMVSIQIYNVSGQLIRVLELGMQPRGKYISKDKAAYWDGTNEVGEPVASGVYFYTLEAGNFTASKKMIILR